MNRRILIFFCLFIIILQLALIVFFQRNLFFSKYNVSYWKDRYEHSQWQLPLSKRGIGDDGLYAYSGLRLIRGENQIFVIADKPPAGLYLIGASIAFLGNPYFYSFIVGIGIMISFYFLSKLLLKDTLLAVLSLTLFVLDPLFFSQLWSTALDSIQLFFLLCSIAIVLCIYRKNSRKLFIGVIAGFTFGLFFETKLQILAPVLFLLESILFLQKKQFRNYIGFIAGIFFAIIVVYSKYMLLGNNLIDVIRIHKHITAIYLSSQLNVHFGAIWNVLFFGRFPDISTGVPTIVQEWWILWPVITIVSVISAILILLKKEKDATWKAVSIFLILSLFIYSVLPSYARYLLIPLPFFYILTVDALDSLFKQAKLYMVLFIIIFYGIINAYLFLLPSPDSVLKNFYHNFTHQYFQDIYEENLSEIGKKNNSGQEFHKQSLKTLKQATIKSIEIKEKKRNIPKFSNQGYVTIEVNYKTQNLGPFSEEKVITLIKENSEWKVIWDWEILLNGFEPGYLVETTYLPGKRGAIKNLKGEILAEDTMGYLISVNPEKIDVKRETEMLNFIGGLEKQPPIILQNEYLENNLPGEYVPLLTSSFLYSDDVKQNILSYPGVKISNHLSRIYNKLDPLSIKNVFYNECCTRIYSSYNYHGITGIEKKYDRKLSGEDGGTVVLKDRSNRIVRVILQKKAKNGQEIIASDL